MACVGTRRAELSCEDDLERARMWVGLEIGCWAGRRGMVRDVVCGSCARGIVGGKCDGESAETPANIWFAWTRRPRRTYSIATSASSGATASTF